MPEPRELSAEERYEALCERVSWFEEGAACEAAVVEAFELGREAERQAHATDERSNDDA